MNFRLDDLPKMGDDSCVNDRHHAQAKQLHVAGRAICLLTPCLLDVPPAADLTDASNYTKITSISLAVTAPCTHRLLLDQYSSIQQQQPTPNSGALDLTTARLSIHVARGVFAKHTKPRLPSLTPQHQSTLEDSHKTRGGQRSAAAPDILPSGSQNDSVTASHAVPRYGLRPKAYKMWQTALPASQGNHQ